MCSALGILAHPVASRSCGQGRLLARTARACSPWHPASRGRSVASQAAADTVAVDGKAEQAPAAARRKRVLSGVQPTGTLHIGNYFGAIRNWVGLQDLYDTFFCVVDLHAITVPHDPKELQDAVRKSAALYVASGIDPARSKIFVQSHVSAHAELAWLLTCTTPIGWLQRMIQFKEKARKQGEDVTTGLLSYPILMAADILLYQADLVPVGEDQRQHLELARDVATRFNNLYGGKKWKKLGGRGGSIFRVPEALIPPAGARVMSLLDGTSKMSKSAENDKSRVNLLDDVDTIVNKVKGAKTDAFDGLELDNPDRPEAINLLTLYMLSTGKTREEALADCGSMRWGQFKPALAEALVEHLKPIQARYYEVVQETGYLDQVLQEGAEAAEAAANRTLHNAFESMGFVPRPGLRR